MSISLELLIVLVLILANGLFSMSEIALVSARKVRLQQRAEDGVRSAKVALQLANAPNRFLSTVQIGITLVGVLTGAVGGATLTEQLALLLARIPGFAPYAQGSAFALVVLLITYFTLILGELIPKRIGLNDPERVSEIVAEPMRLLSKLGAPVVALLSASTELGFRLLGIKPSNEPPVTEDEIKVLMEQGTQVGVFEEAEMDMVESVFRLGGRRVDAMMTPRTEMVWLDLDQPFSESLQLILSSGHSHFPVARDNLDNVIGVLSAKDLLSYLAGTDRSVDLKSLARPALFIPESTPALKALTNMRTSGDNVILVIDEYGGLQGMVTLNDILQTIVGIIAGQGGTVEEQIIRREDGSLLLDGLLAIDEFKDLMDVDFLPDEERVGYQTLAGFVVSQMGAIPTSGQSFEWNGWRFEVMDMDGRRVDKLLATVVQ
jgi:putative hemolysin